MCFYYIWILGGWGFLDAMHGYDSEIGLLAFFFP